MCLCVHAYICVCMLRAYVCTYVCAYECSCVSVCVCVNIHVKNEKHLQKITKSRDAAAKKSRYKRSRDK